MISIYYREEDSAKELFNVELDSQKAFNSVYIAMKESSPINITVNQSIFTKKKKRYYKSIGLQLPLWDPNYLCEYVHIFLYSAVAYIKLFSMDQIKELIAFQFKPLFRENRVISQIGRELNGTFDSVEAILENILFNKSCQVDKSMLNDILLANIELGKKYYQDKETADKIRLDKVHMLLDVFKQR